jgi:hypothetical protein
MQSVHQFASGMKPLTLRDNRNERHKIVQKDRPHSALPEKTCELRSELVAFCVSRHLYSIQLPAVLRTCFISSADYCFIRT